MDIGTAVTGIELCWRVGKALVKSCQTWKAAEEELADRISIIEHAWHRTRIQIEFIERIKLEEEYRRILDDLVRILAQSLSNAIATINQALERKSKKRPGFLEFTRSVKKSKYVLVKSAIDEAIDDVEACQRWFDPTWFLVMRVASSVVDAELSNSVKAEEAVAAAATTLGGPKEATPTRPTQTPLLIAEGLRYVLSTPDSQRPPVYLPNIQLDKRAIPYSNAFIATPRGSSRKVYIAESIICRPGTDLDTLTRDTRVLATRLTAADPRAFGLLSCKGVIKVPGDPATGRHPAFTMVFITPEGLGDGQSLRQFLMLLQSERDVGGGIAASLGRRMSVACCLARSVSSVHTFKFVHKNVRPESVLLQLPPDDDDGSPRTDAAAAFLLGFDGFRSADGATNLRGDIEWDYNLYRHPTRQGEFPAERYRMHHDVYSLGVCLLELGLGESLVDYDAQGVACPGARLRGQYISWLEATGRGSSWDESNHLKEPWGASLHLKDYFEHLAATHVPRYAGSRYSKVVMACLTCLDSPETDTEAEAKAPEQSDPFGFDVGMGFIQDVLLQLADITV